jgi:plastocyanin
MRNIALSVVGGVLLLAGIAWVAGQPAGAATEEIEAGSNYFCAPSFANGVCTTTISAGDSVTWTVAQGVHTVTQCDSTHTTCPLPGGFDSGLLQTAQTFSWTFGAAGDFAYYCAIHPTEMRGVISVVAAPTDTPAPTPTLAPDATGSVSPAMSPAAAPRSGGRAPSDGLPLQALLLAVGGVLAVVGAGSLYAGRRI